MKKTFKALTAIAAVITIASATAPVFAKEELVVPPGEVKAIMVPPEDVETEGTVWLISGNPETSGLICTYEGGGSGGASSMNFMIL